MIWRPLTWRSPALRGFSRKVRVTSPGLCVFCKVTMVRAGVRPDPPQEGEGLHRGQNRKTLPSLMGCFTVTFSPTADSTWIFSVRERLLTAPTTAVRRALVGGVVTRSLPVFVR